MSVYQAHLLFCCVVLYVLYLLHCS